MDEKTSKMEVEEQSEADRLLATLRERVRKETLAQRIETAAQVAHEVNRAYCNALGDASQPAWADAPEWQTSSAINGMKFHLANPGTTPEDSHNSWLREKVANGWVYGEHKDAEAKTHPCIRAYRDLPPEQRVKDYLFQAIAHTMLVYAPPIEAPKEI